MKRFRIIISSILVLLLILLCSCSGGTSIKKDWNPTKLGAILPTPENKKVEISVDSDLLFQAEVSDFSIDDFNAYLESCKEKGFTLKILETHGLSSINSESVTDNFTASNNAGNFLDLRYNQFTSIMKVILSQSK